MLEFELVMAQSPAVLLTLGPKALIESQQTRKTVPDRCFATPQLGQ